MIVVEVFSIFYLCGGNSVGIVDRNSNSNFVMVGSYCIITSDNHNYYE